MFSLYQERLNDLHGALFGFRSSVEADNMKGNLLSQKRKDEAAKNRNRKVKKPYPFFSAYRLPGDAVPERKVPKAPPARGRGGKRVSSRSPRRGRRQNIGGLRRYIRDEGDKKKEAKGGRQSGIAKEAVNTSLAEGTASPPRRSSSSVDTAESDDVEYVSLNVPNRFFRPVAPPPARSAPLQQVESSTKGSTDSAPPASRQPLRHSAAQRQGGRGLARGRRVQKKTNSSRKRVASPLTSPRPGGMSPRKEDAHSTEGSVSSLQQTPRSVSSMGTATPRSSPRTPRLEISTPVRPRYKCASSQKPRVHRSLGENVLEWATAVGIDIQVLEDKPRIYRDFASHPLQRRAPWEALCRASKQLLHHMLTGASQERATGKSRRGVRRQGRSDTEVACESNRVFRQRREHQEWCRSRLATFFDKPSYFTNVWKGLPRQSVDVILGGRYVIPSAFRLDNEIKEYKKFRRRGIALRRLVLKELGLDRIGNPEESHEGSTASNSPRSPGNLSNSFQESPTDDMMGIPKFKKTLGVDIALDMEFDVVGNCFSMRFSSISVDDSGEETETFLGRWRAGCLDNWRWLILSGPLKDKVVSFDTRLPRRYTQEILRNTADTLVMPAVCLTIDNHICFSRVRRQDSPVEHFVCSRCGQFFVESRDQRFNPIAPRRRCWICTRRTDLIPVSSTYEEDKHRLLESIMEAQTASGKRRVIPEKIIRERIKDMVEQTRCELEHKPLWRSSLFL